MDQETTAKPDKPAGFALTRVHFICGWPLVLVFMGGAIGGGLGGLAYGINRSIYNSKLPAYVKVILNPIVGLAAILGWLMIVFAVQAAREG